MKTHKLILAAVFISSVFFTACNDNKVKEEIGTSQTEEEAKELMEAAEQDFNKEKEETMEQLQEKRDNIEKAINTYKAKIDNEMIDAKAEARKAANDAISKLEAAKQKVEKKMTETKNATQENWEQVKLDAKSFANDIQEETDTLTAKIKEMLK